MLVRPTMLIALIEVPEGVDPDELERLIRAAIRAATSDAGIQKGVTKP